MAPDLSPCRAMFETDPVRYLDLTEPVRRGTGEVVYAGPDGALVAVDTGRGVRPEDQLFTLSARDADAARRLCALLPGPAVQVTVHEECAFPALEERLGIRAWNPCWQAGYLSTAPLPELPCGLPFELRPLGPEHLEQVYAHYQLPGEAYLRRRLERGAMLGAFTPGGTLAGFIGRHEEGTIGMLEVLPPYRRRGLGKLLQSRMANLALAEGHTPYCQIFADNEVSLSLQRSLGFQISRGFMYWPRSESD